MCRKDQKMDESRINEMVGRFLGWKLPEDFNPDAGITFTPPSVLYPQIENAEQLWPTGTNLLDAAQAEKMIRHLLDLSA